MADYTFRLAREADRESIVAFLRTHWDSPHPIIENPALFNYYYADGAGGLRFALCETGDRLCAAAGYIPASQTPQPDVWVSLWVADPAARGSGLELMAAMPALTGCRTLSCNNIRPATCRFYEFLGYTTGQLGHFYRLANRDTYQIAHVAHKDIPAVCGVARLTRLQNPDALQKSGFVPPAQANPRKDMWYIARRYFAYPGQNYLVYAACLPGDSVPRALLCARVIPAAGSCVLRIADYIGAMTFLPEMGAAIDGLMSETAAEYADFYCAGIPADTMRSAGFAQQLADDGNILPNYLQPPLHENTSYYYFTSNPEGFVMCKADGDQDRPRTFL